MLGEKWGDATSECRANFRASSTATPVVLGDGGDGGGYCEPRALNAGGTSLCVAFGVQPLLHSISPPRRLRDAACKRAARFSRRDLWGMGLRARARARARTSSRFAPRFTPRLTWPEVTVVQDVTTSRVFMTRTTHVHTYRSDVWRRVITV